MDIELAIDVMEMAEHLDHIIIFSGDGDFRRLVEAVQRKGVRVSVVSTIESQPPMIADELRRQADTFIELADIQKDIQRAGGQKRPPREEDAPFQDDLQPLDDDDEYDEMDDADYDDEVAQS